MKFTDMNKQRKRVIKSTIHTPYLNSALTEYVKLGIRLCWIFANAETENRTAEPLQGQVKSTGSSRVVFANSTHP